MVGIDQRVEIIARAMCRSAGLDPDELIETDARHTRWHFMQPANEPMEAWRRYLIAAENFCAVSRDLLDVDRRH